MTGQLEQGAVRLWRRWGYRYAMWTACSDCGQVRHCRGSRRARMLCLYCFDLGRPR